MFLVFCVLGQRMGERGHVADPVDWLVLTHPQMRAPTTSGKQEAKAKSFHPEKPDGATRDNARRDEGGGGCRTHLSGAVGWKIHLPPVLSDQLPPHSFFWSTRTHADERHADHGDHALLLYVASLLHYCVPSHHQYG
jgi:hypothetical protein